jgi:hypothetical protein
MAVRGERKATRHPVCRRQPFERRLVMAALGALVGGYLSAVCSFGCMLCSLAALVVVPPWIAVAVFPRHLALLVLWIRRDAVRFLEREEAAGAHVKPDQSNSIPKSAAESDRWRCIR